MHPMFRGQQPSQSDNLKPINAVTMLGEYPEAIPEESESDHSSSDAELSEPRSSEKGKVSKDKKKDKKSKKSSKKLKKGIKKAFKIAATPVVAAGHVAVSTGTMATSAVTAVGSSAVTAVGSSVTAARSSMMNAVTGEHEDDLKKKEKKKKDKKKKKEDDFIDLDDEERSSGIVSLVKYEKLKSQLSDKKDLVDTLFSKIELLEETIAEKDEIILRLQNLDILASTLQEKDEIIAKLMANEKVDKKRVLRSTKSNDSVLSQMSKKKKDLENRRKSYRRLGSKGQNDLIDDLSESYDDTFVAWKREDRRFQKQGSFDNGVTPVGFSRMTSAEEERRRRQESSDLLHKLRKANKKNKSSPKTHKKKKEAQPWNGLTHFLLPVFDKTEEERDIIRKAFESNYIFEDLSLASLDTFIQAFENVQVKKGHVIQRQGEAAHFFYVVAEGEISIEADGTSKKAGVGTTIGATALLHASAPKTTVIAETEPTKLFRVDEKTFRFKMKKVVKESNDKKIELLKNIPWFKDFESADLQRLADSMLERKFEKGEEVVSKDKVDDTFYVVSSGAMTVTTGEDGCDDQVLEKGGYFGENALTKKSAVSTASLVGHEKGWCFGIDSATFERVLGSYNRLITKAKDKAILKKVKLIKDSRLDENLLNSMTDAIVSKFFEKGSVIQEMGEIADAALYIVREGSVTIGASRVIQAGESFGADQLAADVKNLSDPGGKLMAKFTAMATEDARCGVLTLAECRLLMDTKTDFKVGGDALGGRVKKDHRAIMKRRSIGMSMGIMGSSSMGDDLSADFANERQAVRDFYRSFRTPIDQLPREKVLGEGQFGEVWLVSLKEGELKEDFALKIQDLGDAYESETIENIYREMKVIKLLQHPFIVDLIDSKESDEKSYMLMTLCTGGELWSAVHRKGEDGQWQNGVSEEDAKFYCLIVADTLAYMHRKNVLYRDLKPENVLLDAGGYPNIIDFGFSKVTTEKTYTLCGTPNYMAPEIILIAGHHVGADHWALGIMIYEMISGEHPFYYEGLNNAELFDLVTKTEAFPCEKASPEAQAILNGLLEKDPTQRLGVLAGKERDILKHEWFKGLDLGKLRKREIQAPWIPPPP